MGTGPIQRLVTNISSEVLNHGEFINNRRRDNKDSHQEMTKSKFNRMIQEVGGRLPCWREDTYEINRKSQEKGDPSSNENEGSATSEKSTTEADQEVDVSIHDPNWARKKKAGYTKGTTKMKVLDTNEDKMFPRKRKSDLLMIY